MKCHPLPTRVYRVDAYEMRLFRNDFIDIFSRRINSMDWKNASQVEAYLRCGLLNTYDLVVSLQKHIADMSFTTMLPKQMIFYIYFLSPYGHALPHQQTLFFAHREQTLYTETKQLSQTPQSCTATCKVFTALHRYGQHGSQLCSASSLINLQASYHQEIKLL